VPSIPESFKLLTKQLQGLALCINVKEENGVEEDMNNYTSVISDEEMKENDVENSEAVTITPSESNSYEEDEQF
jgi:DNA-directed RNA polymerase subunit beta